MGVSVKPKFNQQQFLSKKTLAFISLLFMTTILFTPHISKANGMWTGITTSTTVGTEVELTNTINAAPYNEICVIHISKDIVLEKPLEIIDGKRILLIGYDRDVCLIGANGMDTIIVKSGGQLAVAARLTVTHVEGDVGRGVYVERDGRFDVIGAIISGNVADRGGGVYNEGTFSFGGDADRGGLIANNTANLGGGVYNEGTFSIGRGGIHWNSAVNTETSVGMGGGVYNKGTFITSSNEHVRWSEIYSNVATLGGGVYTEGVFEGVEYVQIVGNTALSGEGNNVFNEAVVGGESSYLLPIAGAVAIAVVVGLFFCRLRWRGSLVVKGLGDSVGEVK
ncbi:MAG: hypothetical protein FWD52_02995 [Candidatus Bathyarchaeota archaeon]|nr:hypothetical protein [Candidatus Termiticorpusculum sp.]